MVFERFALPLLRLVLCLTVVVAACRKSPVEMAHSYGWLTVPLRNIALISDACHCPLQGQRLVIWSLSFVSMRREAGDMMISLHKNATTTPSIRQRQFGSDEPAAVFALHYGVSGVTA